MYGNNTLPGVAVSDTYRLKGSIWRGYVQSTWFKLVQVNGSEEEASAISVGTIMKQATDGSYTPITTADIISATANLPGVRLAIVADKTAKTGTTTGSEATPSTVLVGISGTVDKAKLLVGETAFDDLTDEQKINLNTQLEAWHFQLVEVM